MDFFQYKNLRAFAMEPIAEHFSTSAAVRAREVVGEIFGSIGPIQHERDRAIDFWGCIDLSPQQQAAAHLLAVISNHWAIAWWRDADTPDGSEPLPALEPEQKAQLCNETLQAAQQYAAFLPERQAAALLALVPEPQAATPAPVVAESAQGDEAWKERAREKAGEIIKRQKAIDAYPSQEAIADEIARAFRQDGIVGAGGKPLTGAYIKRHALKGISSEQDKQLSTSIRRGK